MPVVVGADAWIHGADLDSDHCTIAECSIVEGLDPPAEGFLSGASVYAGAFGPYNACNVMVVTAAVVGSESLVEETVWGAG